MKKHKRAASNCSATLTHICHTLHSKNNAHVDKKLLDGKSSKMISPQKATIPCYSNLLLLKQLHQQKIAHMVSFPSQEALKTTLNNPCKLYTLPVLLPIIPSIYNISLTLQRGKNNEFL